MSIHQPLAGTRSTTGFPVDMKPSRMVEVMTDRGQITPGMTDEQVREAFAKLGITDERTLTAALRTHSVQRYEHETGHPF